MKNVKTITIPAVATASSTLGSEPIKLAGGETTFTGTGLAAVPAPGAGLLFFWLVEALACEALLRAFCGLANGAAGVPAVAADPSSISLPSFLTVSVALASLLPLELRRDSIFCWIFVA